MKILYVCLKWYFWQKWKILMSVLGLNSKDGKSTRDKANISDPKVNRGCAPLTASRISADCVQISLGPSIPYIPLGVYHTGGFNAMFNTFCTMCNLYSLCRKMPNMKNISFRTWRLPCDIIFVAQQGRCGEQDFISLINYQWHAIPIWKLADRFAW